MIKILMNSKSSPNITTKFLNRHKIAMTSFDFREHLKTACHDQASKLSQKACHKHLPEHYQVET